MEVSYRTQNGRFTFKVQGEDVKAIFAQIAAVQEVFDADTECGCCQSKDIRFLHRKVDDYLFYELSCNACHARFSFGQAKKGGALFPKRKDENGEWSPNRGWSKWQPKGEDTQPTPAAPTATRGPVPAPQPAAAAPKTNGVASFPDWDKAQESPRYGDKWLNVGGTLYMLKADGSSYVVPPKESK